ncbi:hypothetical protein CXB51_012037 [Gossypium anomalum]|uniref:Large ribosomal subunit protein eL20 domain-containing protein n=3 Tax=Gossypium TaxID=3633 RepID=A0A8J6D0W9_9ROSI|nr:hypothetical protein CXB51_012037 [Gossypium anomalum]
MVTFRFHQYQVVGRALPTESDEHPKIYRMKLWASNEVRAKSKFWYFLRKLKKVKKSNGQVLAINEIFEKNPTKIKNYGIWLRYQSRTGYHNMYKEYRDTTLNGAVEQMYTEMASRHRVRFPCIQIIKTATIPAKLCKRDNTKQFHNSKIKFPLMVKKVRPPTRKLKTTYKASRPNLFMTDHAPCNWRDLGWEWNFRKKRIQDSGTRNTSANLRAIHVSMCSPIIMNHPTQKLLLGGRFEIFRRRGDNICSRKYCPGRTAGILDNDEHKHFSMDCGIVHNVEKFMREYGNLRHYWRQEQAAAHREKLRHAYLRKQVKLKSASKTEQA